MKIKPKLKLVLVILLGMVYVMSYISDPKHSNVLLKIAHITHTDNKLNSN